MKKMSLLLLTAFAMTVTVYAQPGGNFQRRTVEERVAIIHAKLDSAFKLETTMAANVDSVFAEYYRATDKLREEMMASGDRPDFKEMQKKMDPIVETRDDKLKKMLPEKQYETWKKDIEPTMRRPQRQQGGNR
jgi:hypothetical protein